MEVKCKDKKIWSIPNLEKVGNIFEESKGLTIRVENNGEIVEGLLTDVGLYVYAIYITINNRIMKGFPVHEIEKVKIKHVSKNEYDIILQGDNDVKIFIFSTQKTKLNRTISKER